jgi:hypothetical protein
MHVILTGDHMVFGEVLTLQGAIVHFGKVDMIAVCMSEDRCESGTAMVQSSGCRREK